MPAASSVAAHEHARQVLGQRALFEGLPGRLGRCFGRVPPVDQRGRFRGEPLLRLVEFGPGQAFQPADLIERQHREEPQEPTDVGILGVAPELPVIIGRQQVGLEPNRACGGLSHLGAQTR